jgi:anion-transporting  ArsA/GET3 family ATPase
MPDSLRKLVETRHVLITVGAGGVGKTTTAAAIGVAAARMGRRVLCLTIDPAKRLAESLGLKEMTTDAVAIAPARFEAAGIAVKGGLTVAMVDTKRTFDELVKRYSSSPEKAKTLLDNKLYKYVSTSLAGTQEYMAMERLIAVEQSGEWDLIVLDTPPTTNALDFLDAPDTLVNALDSAAMRWFIEAFQSTGKMSLNVLARTAAAVLRGIGRLTGGGFLEDVAEFVTELNDLFGGFRQRASVVRAALRAPNVSFVLVTTPAPMSIQEVLYFSDRLKEHSMPRGAFVVNRFREPPERAESPPTRAEVAAAVRAQGLVLDDDAPDRLLRAHADQVKLAALDKKHVAKLGVLAGDDVNIVRVPELATDVYDLRLLAQVGDVLMGGA